ARHRPFFSLPVPGIDRIPRDTLEKICSGDAPRTIGGFSYAMPEGGNAPAVLRLTPLTDGTGAVIGVVGVLSPLDRPRGAATGSERIERSRQLVRRDRL